MKINMDKLPKTLNEDIKRAIKILKSYKCSEIYVFGSIAKGNYRESSDIDIAVRGIKPEIFFDAYADLSFNLESKVDLVNLDTNERFADLLFDIKELVRVA